MQPHTPDVWHGTTILTVRKGGTVAIGGDGQVTICLLYTSDAADE